MLVTFVTNEEGNFPGFRARVIQIKQDSPGTNESRLAEQKHLLIHISWHALLWSVDASLSMVIPF